MVMIWLTFSQLWIFRKKKDQLLTVVMKMTTVVEILVDQVSGVERLDVISPRLDVLLPPSDPSEASDWVLILMTY